jgi:hypothetical protein
MSGEIAKALKSKASELLQSEPKIESVEIVASKTGAVASRAKA